MSSSVLVHVSELGRIFKVSVFRFSFLTHLLWFLQSSVFGMLWTFLKLIQTGELKNKTKKKLQLLLGSQTQVSFSAQETVSVSPAFREHRTADITLILFHTKGWAIPDHTSRCVCMSSRYHCSAHSWLPESGVSSQSEHPRSVNVGKRAGMQPSASIPVYCLLLSMGWMF